VTDGHADDTIDSTVLAAILVHVTLRSANAYAVCPPSLNKDENTCRRTRAVAPAIGTFRAFELQFLPRDARSASAVLLSQVVRL